MSYFISRNGAEFGHMWLLSANRKSYAWGVEVYYEINLDNFQEQRENNTKLVRSLPEVN